MNDVVTFKPQAGQLVEADAFANALSASAGTVQLGGGMPILKLDRAGVWCYGPANNEVEEDVRLAINPLTMKHGWQCWGDSANLLGQETAPITQVAPAMPSDIDGFRPVAMFEVDMVILEGDDKGTAVVYKPSSVGGKRAVSELLSKIAVKVKDGGMGGTIVPVVKLDVESYTHKQYGRIFNPILEVVDWATLDQEVAPEAKDEEKKPTRRRRRRA